MEDSKSAINSQTPVVFFDLETTGLGQTCEIVQLAAVSEGHWLNLYTVPRSKMQPGASRVTGFKVSRHRLYLHRQPVLTNSLREILVAFIAFLRMRGSPLLVGHNIRRFDCPVLARALDEVELRPEFVSSISGCVDTLPLAREILQEHCLQSFRQENLVREVLGVKYVAHDALEDVRALQMLYQALQPTAELLSKHTFTLDNMENKSNIRTAEVKVLPPPPQPGQRPLWEHFRQAVRVTESSGSSQEGHSQPLSQTSLLHPTVPRDEGKEEIK